MFQVGIYLYEDAEVLDFAGPFEVFTTAGRMYQRSHPGEPPLFVPLLIGDVIRPIRARGGFTVTPHAALKDHPHLDVVVVPGGIHTPEMQRQQTLAWLKQVSPAAVITASVCTGAFILAAAGLLDGKMVTTHWEDIPDLRTAFPTLVVIENTRWVDQGQVITSAGISAGVDMSLHIVSRLAGMDLARRTARQMEFDWQT